MIQIQRKYLRMYEKQFKGSLLISNLIALLIWNNTTALLNHPFMNHALIVNHHSTDVKFEDPYSRAMVGMRSIISPELWRRGHLSLTAPCPGSMGGSVSGSGLVAATPTSLAISRSSASLAGQGRYSAAHHTSALCAIRNAWFWSYLSFAWLYMSHFWRLLRVLKKFS